MTVAELISDLQSKPPTYEVRKAGEGAVHETSTDHENQKVVIY